MTAPLILTGERIRPKPKPRARKSRSLIYDSMLHVCISSPPAEAELVAAGEQTVLLRRQFPEYDGEAKPIYIYALAPVKAVVANGYLIAARRLPLADLWRWKAEAHIERRAFDTYFSGLTHGQLLCLSMVRPLPKPIDGNFLLFRPFRNFRYVRAPI